MAHAWVHAYYNAFTKRQEKLADYVTNPNLAITSYFMCAETDEEALRIAKPAWEKYRWNLAAPRRLEAEKRNLTQFMSTKDGSFGFVGERPKGLPTRELRRDIDAELERAHPDMVGKTAEQKVDELIAMLHGEPLATSVHFPMQRAGVIGLPVAECELKLVPSAGKLEVRVRGPNVTPGYYKREEITRAAFDEEGFYRIGDAVKFAEPDDPAKGIVFDGRVAEDFKLSTGTWVHAGAVRVKLIAAADPLIQDAVITGQDRTEIGALVFPSPGTKDMSPEAIRSRLSAVLAQLAQEGGSSMVPRRLLLMTEPPSIDANEITDKGYINQRAALERRAALVERLYAGGPDVIS